MNTYHIIKGDQHIEVTSAQLDSLQESNEPVLLDIDWYLSHGAMTLEEFLKTHPTIK